MKRSIQEVRDELLERFAKPLDRLLARRGWKPSQEAVGRQKQAKKVKKK